MITGVFQATVKTGRIHHGSHECGMVDATPRPARSFSRVTGLLAAVLIAGCVLAAPLAAYASDHATPVPAYTMTPKRLAASTAALTGLIAAVIGTVALARAKSRIGNGGRRGAMVAVVLGPIALIIGGLVVATADGGLGTGNGLAGGVVAMVLGLIGITLGGLTLARSHRTA